MKNACKFCRKHGHSSAHCTAKETGFILVLYNLLKDLLSFPSIPYELVTRLRNKAPTITIERLSGHYEDIDESSDDELDVEVRSTKSAPSVQVNGKEELQPPAEIPTYPPSSPPRSTAESQHLASAGTFNNSIYYRFVYYS